jgi:O-antigen/teichoic acid export membrane protein
MRIGDLWWFSIMMFFALRCGDLINAFVGLWLVPIYVGTEELGAVLPLTQFATSVGTPMVVLVFVFSKFLNRYKTLGEEGKIKSMLIWFIGIAVVLTVLTSLVSILLLPHFFDRIRVQSGSLAILILASGLLGAVSLVFSSALQGLKKFNTITIINFFSAPIRLIVMLIAMPFRALSGYMLGQVAAPAFQIFAACFSLRKNFSKSVKATPFWREDGKEIARYAGLVAITPIIGAFTVPITYMVIRQRLPEVESAAYYIISRFSEIATYAGQTMISIMFPLAAEAQTKGKESLKLLGHMSVGTVGFGVIAAMGLYLCGEWVFNLIPTCRPYSTYVPDMALLAVSMTVGFLWNCYSNYEIACNRFGYLIYGGILDIFQVAFLVCFTGYTFFDGILSPAVIDWMASLKIATLRNFILTILIINLVRVACVAIEILIRQKRSSLKRATF